MTEQGELFSLEDKPALSSQSRIIKCPCGMLVAHLETLSDGYMVDVEIKSLSTGKSGAVNYKTGSEVLAADALYRKGKHKLHVCATKKA